MADISGFSDANPDETIFRGKTGGIAVGVLYFSNFYHKRVPVRQFKDTGGIQKKIRAASQLRDYLIASRESNGLRLFGAIWAATAYAGTKWHLSARA